jgi:hypothetical protein
MVPEHGHLAAFSGVWSDELQSEAVYQGPARPQRAQAAHGEYDRGHRSLDQQQPGIVADQAEHRAHEDPGQDQGTDHVKPTVPDGADGHACGREHPAQQQSGHCPHASRAQQAVGRERAAHVEDHDHRDRAKSVGRC